MRDVREEILQRLVVIVDAVADFKQVYRNYVDLNETDLPAASILDGDEDTNIDAATEDKPTLTTMTPEIVVFKLAPQVGPDISDLRRKLVKAVLYDTELNEQIVKTGRYGNGAIRYLGCQTDLGWERSMFGALKINLSFKYSLKPWEL